MPGELCTLATFTDMVEASIVVNRLKDEGIPAQISGDTSSGLFGMTYAMGGMDIMVLESDLDRAQVIVEVLMAEREEPWERDALPADALPVTVGSDDPERSQAVQTARGTATEPQRVYDGPPADAAPAAEPPERYEPDEPAPPTATGDRIVSRAFRAAAFAWLLGPLMPVAYVYSLVLLFQCGSDDFPLSPGGRVKYYFALTIDLVAISVILLVFGSIWLRLFW